MGARRRGCRRRTPLDLGHVDATSKAMAAARDVTRPFGRLARFVRSRAYFPRSIQCRCRRRGASLRGLRRLTLMVRTPGCLLAVLLFTTTVIPAGGPNVASETTEAAGNPIVLENQQPGSGNWMWSTLADLT